MHYITFAIAIAIVIVIPGPGVMLVTSQALSLGKKSVLPLVAGTALGDTVLVTMAVLALSVILDIPVALQVFQFLCGSSLALLGIRGILQYPANGKNSGKSRGGPFTASFLMAAFNPKTLAFLIAFIPGFTNHQIPMLPQLIVLGSIWLFIGTLNAAVYAGLAASLQSAICNQPVWNTRLRLLGSMVVIVCGVSIMVFSFHPNRP